MNYRRWALKIIFLLLIGIATLLSLYFNPLINKSAALFAIILFIAAIFILTIIRFMIKIFKRLKRWREAFVRKGGQK